MAQLGERPTEGYVIQSKFGRSSVQIWLAALFFFLFFALLPSELYEEEGETSIVDLLTRDSEWAAWERISLDVPL